MHGVGVGGGMHCDGSDAEFLARAQYTQGNLAAIGYQNLVEHVFPGGEWRISLGDMMLAFSLFVLFFEILKSTRTGGNSVVDHALSMIVFVVCLILFLVWPPAATSLFFLIMLTTLIDVIAGFSVTIRSARRDYSVGSDS